jgi:hypothetical protein
MLSPKVIEMRRGSAHCEPVDRNEPATSHGTDVRLVETPAAESIRRSPRRPAAELRDLSRFAAAA